MQNLKTVDLPFGKKTKWFVTHVDDGTGHIYCQLSEPSISVKYERLYQDIHAWSEMETLQEKILNPFIGEFCLSEYALDKSWYRSQIAEVDGSLKQAEVFFIDHGNSEVLAFEAIRKLPTAFAELPAQAYECVLANVEPILKTDRWSEKAIELIKELVLEQELNGIPIRLSKNLLVLKLFADNDSFVTVAEQLVSAGFGQTKLLSIGSGSDSSLPRTNSVSSLDSASSRRSSSSTTSSAPKSLESFKKFNIQTEQYIDLRVVFSEGIEKFFCQAVNSQKELEAMQELLQNFYSQNQPSLSKFPKDLTCCVKFKEDDQWYRAVIKRHLSNSAHVFFVDFGNSDEVSKDYIKALDSQFWVLPAMAIECELSDIAPLSNGKFSSEANTKFGSLTMDCESIVGYVSKVTNNKAEIILYDRDDNPISQQLVQDGLVISSKSNQPLEVLQASTVVHPHSSCSIATDNNQVSQTMVKYIMPSVTAGLQEKIYICYTINPHNFYVNFCSTSDSLQQLMSQISSLYKNQDAKVGDNLPIGYPCIAKYAEDGEYYRAEILECKKDNVKVHFVDYGNTEETNISELKTLRKEFIKLPKQAIACKLSGIEAVTENFMADACQKFEEIVFDKELVMTVQDIQNGTCVVDLEEINENGQIKLNIMKTLISSGLVKEGKDGKRTDFGTMVLNETRFGECKVDVECYIDVAPVHIDNPTQFCCHVVQNAVEFKKMTDDLNEYYSKTEADSSIQWKKLMPCIALYDVDNSWYRATITSVSRSSLEVTFIDFGNSADVPVTNARPIMSSFMKLPAQVFVCSLADIKPDEKSWTAEAIEQFQNLALDKHLAAYIKEKYENNSYSVVLYDTKTSEKNISQLLIEQKHAMASSTSQNIIGCSRYFEPQAKEEGHVTSVESLEDFWIQLPHMSPHLDQLMDQIHNYYSQVKESDLKIINPIIGQYCCSCFTEDDGWYRACIKEVDGKSVTVEYIDYGNSEYLSLDRVKVLTSDFDGSQRYAFPCCLHNHENLSGFSPVVDTLLEKDFMVEFKSKEPPFKVELYTEGQPLSKIIAEEISKKKTATKAITEETKVKSEETKIKTEVTKIVKTATTISKNITLFAEKVINDTVYPMYFLEASSPHEFYCQPAASENELAELMDDIAAFIIEDKMQPFKGQLGDCGLAIYKEDNGCYRVRVLEKIKQNFKVLYCDYGNKDIISKDEVYALPSYLSTLEQQAVLCSLSRLKSTSNEWTNGAIEMFNTLCAEKKMDVKVQGKADSKLNVTLTDPSTGENLEERLIGAGFAKFEETSANIETSKPKTTYKYTPPKLSDKETGFCTCVLSADSLKVQIGKYEDQLNELMEKLVKEATTCSQLSLVKAGDACLAIFSEDQQWYRAEVVNVEGSKATVVYVDYGNSEQCDIESLKSPNSSMVELPKTCIECKLHDVHLTDLDASKVEEHLKNTLLEQAVTVELKSQLDDKNCVEAYIYQDGSADRVNDLLYSLFAPEEEPEKSTDVTPEEKPAILNYKQSSLSEKELGYCTCVSSADSIKVQLGKYEDELNVLMEKLVKDASSCSQLKSVKAGDACLVTFSEDQQWYRAEVTSVEGSKAMVLFVDYGNSEECDTDSLKSPLVSMMELPRTCINCKLYDVNLTELDVSKVEEYLKNTLLEQKLVLELKSELDGNNSAAAYVYQDGCMDHENDVLYSLFALEELEGEESNGTQPIFSAPEQEPTKLKFSLPSLLEKESGFCTHINAPDSLKVQLGKYEDQLNETMEKLAKEASSCSQLTSAEAGDGCLAIFSEDQQWYRTEVVNVEGSKATVAYIDYGNTEECDVSSLKSPIPSMVELPKTCIECKLHDVHITDLDASKVEEYLKNTLLEQAVTVELKSQLDDKNCVEAYIYQDGSADHVNDLLYSLFALEEEEEKTSDAPQISSSEETLQPVQVPAVQATPKESVKPVEVPTPKTVECKISRPTVTSNTDYSAICYVVDSATKLQCQICTFKDQVDSLMNMIAEKISTLQPLSKAVAGEYCIAKYSVDDRCYRGRITEVNEDAIHVYFLDFGNTEDVALSDLRIMTPEFATLQQTCISVDLQDVYEEDIDIDKTKEWLEGKLLGHVIRLECISVDADSVSAYVYAEGRDEHVNDQIYEFFAVEEEVSTVAATDLDILQPELTESSYYGFCYVVESANMLKCQLQQHSEQLDQIMVKIDEQSPSLPQETKITIGKPCIVKYALDGGWYRGRVTQNAPEVKVEFLDFGNISIVPAEDIKIMPDEFKMLPQTCLSVILHDVHLKDIDVNNTRKWLADNFLEQSLRLEVIDTSKNPIIEANVYQEIFNEWKDTHINDHIYSLYTLDTVQDDTSGEDSGISEGGSFVIEYPTIEPNTKEHVICTHIESPVVLKCQLEKLGKDLDQMAEQFQAYSAKTPVLEKFNVGSFCLAMFTADELWYRAQILKEFDDTVTVEFIDYGNTDIISKSSTRGLCAEFVNIPRCNVDVHLYGALASEIDDWASCMEWLCENFMNKTLEIDILSYQNLVADAEVFEENNKTSISKQLRNYVREKAAVNTTTEAIDTTTEAIDTTTETVDTTTGAIDTTTESENTTAFTGDGEESYNDKLGESDLIDVKDHTQTSIAEYSTDVIEDLSSLKDASTISGITPLSDTENEENSYTFPMPDVEEKEAIFCTYVDSVTKLSFQLLKYERELNAVTELLVEEPPSELFDVKDLKCNLSVVAKSVADGEWYRASIVGDVEDEHVNVLYIDFGNTEVLPIDNLRKPSNDLLMHPATCVNCKLHNVGNVDDEKAKEWLETNCLDQIFNAEFIKGKNDTKQVVIYFSEKEDSTSINQQLQTQFPMQIDSVILKRTALDGSINKRKQKINYVKGTEVETINDEHGYLWIVLKKDTYEKATCSFVEKSNLLHFQLTRLKSKLERLMSTIASEAEDLPGVRFLEEGAPCIAQYVDLAWYRGKVLSTSTGCALVEFVDYGNKDDVITEDIRVIKRPEMVVEHVYSVKCKLHGVNMPVDNEADVMEYLSKTLTDDAPEVYLKIVDFDTAEMIANVVIIQDGQDINEFLKNDYVLLMTFGNGGVKPGDEIKVKIPYTNSLSKFWCQLSDTECDFNILLETLAGTYSSQEIDRPDVIEVGQAYCVFSNKQWLRAIAKKVSGNAAVMFMVDNGATESVDLESIRLLQPKFYELDEQGFMATLFDIRPYKNAETWSDAAITYFNEICKDVVLTATIVNSNDDVRSVALVTSNGETVYELLTNQHFAETSIRSVDDETPLSNGH